MRFKDWLALMARAADGEGGSTGDGSEGGSSDGAGGDAPAKSGGGDTLFAQVGDGDDKEGDDAEAEAEGGTGGKVEEGKPYDPGKLPDGVLGKNDAETIDNLVARNNDLRRALSKGKHKEAADVPETLEDYKIEATGEDDLVAKALNNDEESGEVMALVRAAAAEAKLGQGQFDTFVRKFIEAGGNAGMLMSDEDAMQISGKAEMEKLVSEAGSAKAANEIVATTKEYGKLMVEQGVMHKEDLAEWEIMCGTAQASRIMHSLLTSIGGFKPVPLKGERGEGHYTHDEAYALHGEALAMKPGPEKDAALEKAERIMAKTFGDDPASDSREVRRRATA